MVTSRIWFTTAIDDFGRNAAGPDPTPMAAIPTPLSPARKRTFGRVQREVGQRQIPQKKNPAEAG
jgi:hypothetical protein